eukprot:355872-Chlamydomonas_euryale.AAC.4
MSQCSARSWPARPTFLGSRSLSSRCEACRGLSNPRGRFGGNGSGCPGPLPPRVRLGEGRNERKASLHPVIQTSV